MSNKRIDLTQFEGMTEGPWESYADDEGKILGPISERHRNNHPVVAVVGYGWWGDLMPESDANKRAMTAAPELIAELKRCYEQMDWLHQVADLATDYIGEIHHSHWDIFEERMFAAGLWERPSE